MRSSLRGWLCFAVVGSVGLLTAAFPSAQQPTSYLDEATARAFVGRTGTAVVLDVDSGRILSQHRIDLAARTLAHPGSTLKPFVLQALLERGLVDSHTSMACPTRLEIDGRRLDCTHPQTGEPVDAVTALSYSCNNFFAHFGPRLSAADLAQALRRDGLASITGLAADEAAGRIDIAASEDELRLQALGESAIEITPLELLAAYRQIALQRKQLRGSDDAFPLVFAGLEEALRYGTAHAAAVEGLAVAGKTGTATALDGRWTHAWFAGFTPADDPEIVLVVFLERGRGGSDAAPVARQIFASYQAYRQPEHKKP